MVVMKFGGSSVKDADAMRRVADIVRRGQDRGRGSLVVVSAMSRVTDQLIHAAALAANGAEPDVTPMVDGLGARHRQVAASVALPARQPGLISELDADWREVTQLLHALAILRDLSPRSLDAIVAAGEIASSRILTAALQAVGVSAIWVDPRRALVTDEEHGAAQPDMAATRERMDEEVQPHLAAGRLPVLGGFIGATKRGVTSTLGRGGSDYSASIFGAALGAAEIQIWTDVDGMLTADPRVVPGTRSVPNLSFAEASELAYFGAKVLHPSTIAPAVAAGIPVRILNSHRQEAPGTTIVASPPPASTPLTALACKRDVTVIDITSSRMLMAHGFLRRLFEVFERYRTAVDVVTTSEVSVSVTVDDTRHLDAILAALGEFAEVTSEREMALLCAVGERLRIDPSLSMQILGALEGFPLRMVSQAGARRNVTVVLPQEHLAAAMAQVHDRFCTLQQEAAHA
ncbi:MAG: aspartate kinase [Luteitalea sp.]|nr:aspartate kinase [Luteitalea sp.]